MTNSLCKKVMFFFWKSLSGMFNRRWDFKAYRKFWQHPTQEFLNTLIGIKKTHTLPCFVFFGFFCILRNTFLVDLIINLNKVTQFFFHNAKFRQSSMLSKFHSYRFYCYFCAACGSFIREDKTHMFAYSVRLMQQSKSNLNCVFLHNYPLSLIIYPHQPKQLLKSRFVLETILAFCVCVISN